MKFDSSKSETTFISKELRGSGQFEKLYFKALDYCKNDNQDFIWGFTALSKIWQNKLKFVVFENSIYEGILTVKVSNDNKLQVKQLINLLSISRMKVNLFFGKFWTKKYLKLKRVDNILQFYLNFQLDKENNNFIEIESTNEFINWRIINNPLLEYKLYSILDFNDKVMGYFLFHIKDEKAYISDIKIEEKNLKYVFPSIIEIITVERVNSIMYFGNIENPINKSVFSQITKFGGKKILNKSMNFVLKSNSAEFKKYSRNLVNWRINGLWTEGFTY